MAKKSLRSKRHGTWVGSPRVKNTDKGQHINLATGKPKAKEKDRETPYYTYNELGAKVRLRGKELKRHEIVYTDKGQPIPNPMASPGLISLTPTGPADLAFETAFLGMSESEGVHPSLAILAGLAAPATAKQVLKMGKSGIKKASKAVQSKVFPDRSGNMEASTLSIGELDAQYNASIAQTIGTSDKIKTSQAIQSLKGEKAALKYKSQDFIFDASKGADDVDWKWRNLKRGTDHTVTSQKMGWGTRYEMKIERVKKASDPKYSLEGNPYAQLRFWVEPMKHPEFGEIMKISQISYFAGGGAKGTGYAGRLVHDLIDKMPGNAVIIEDSLTFDSLYLLINQAVKKSAKIIFDMKGERMFVPPGTRGFLSNMVYGAKNDKELKLSINKVMNNLRTKLSRSPHVTGRPQLKFEQGKSEISMNQISVHKMMSGLALSFGFENKKDFLEFLSYDPESVESQVFDKEISF